MARIREMDTETQLEMRTALAEVQETFPYTEQGFLFFAQVCVHSLIRGEPDLNRVQADICKYLFSGSKYRMIQAQRG